MPVHIGLLMFCTGDFFPIKVSNRVSLELLCVHLKQLTGLYFIQMVICTYQFVPSKIIDIWGKPE